MCNTTTTTSSSIRKSIRISRPFWVIELEESLQDKIFATDEEMMQVAISAAAQNVERNTGGPFATTIFERTKATGESRLVSIGVNLVVPASNSTLHGEMTAIQFAEQKLQSHKLEATETREYILCTSCEPCCMCLGGTLWSGVAELMCSAAKSDAEAIGFNEGPVFPESYLHLLRSGMRIKRRVLHAQGAAVLKQYGEEGVIY